MQISTLMRTTILLATTLVLAAPGFLHAQPRLLPTHADVRYGPHPRHVLDFWQAESDRPTPVVVAIHGGGFTKGDKGVNADLLRSCVDNGISVAAITYRYSTEVIAPAQFHDGARAVQFLRSKAKLWNIDGRRVGATGGSAGAGISLWLGFHDDLADPKNADPVLRESSRVACMAVFEAQSSYDPRLIRRMFPHAPRPVAGAALTALFGIKDIEDPDRAAPEKIRLFEEVSPLNHVTKEDGPVLMSYVRTMDAEPNIHHPLFGKLLKEKMDGLGIPCEVIVGREKPDFARAFAFFNQHLKEQR